jgi:hypothetical protein
MVRLIRYHVSLAGEVIRRGFVVMLCLKKPVVIDEAWRDLTCSYLVICVCYGLDGL